MLWVFGKADIMTQSGPYSLGGDGLCVGRDSGSRHGVEGMITKPTEHGRRQPTEEP